MTDQISPAIEGLPDPPPSADELTPEIRDETLSRLTNLCRLLSEKWRFKIVIALTSGEEMSADDLVALVGLSHQAIHKNLKLMHLAGLVSCRRQGKYQFYRLASGYFHDLLKQFEAAFCWHE